MPNTREENLFLISGRLSVLKQVCLSCCSAACCTSSLTQLTKPHMVLSKALSSLQHTRCLNASKQIKMPMYLALLILVTSGEIRYYHLPALLRLIPYFTEQDIFISTRQPLDYQAGNQATKRKYSVVPIATHLENLLTHLRA